MTIDPEYLAGGYEGNLYVLGRLTDGLTHEDSLLTPAFGGNCLNWLLGHVLTSRNTVCDLLNLEPALPKDRAALYKTGSAPITRETAVPLGYLQGVYESSTAVIAGELRQRTAEDMAVLLQSDTEDDPSPLGRRLMGLYWHESYHIGQVELLRRLAGRTEKVFG